MAVKGKRNFGDEQNCNVFFSITILLTYFPIEFSKIAMDLKSCFKILLGNVRSKFTISARKTGQFGGQIWIKILVSPLTTTVKSLSVTKWWQSLYELNHKHM